MQRKWHRWIMARDKENSNAMAEREMTADIAVPRSMRDELTSPAKPNPNLHLVTDEPPADAPADMPAGNADGMAVLVRRLDNLENIVADIARVVEQHEIVLREREDTLTSVAQAVLAFQERMEQWEKDRAKERADRAKETADLRAALTEAETRLNDLEAQKSAVPVGVVMQAASKPMLAEPPPKWADTVASPMPADATPAPEVPPAAAKDSQSQSYLMAARRAAIAGTPSSAKNIAVSVASARRLPRAQYLVAGCAAPLIVVAAATFALNRHPAVAEAVAVSAPFKPAGEALLPPPPPPDLIITPLADPAAAELDLAPLGALQEKAKGGDAKAARDIGLKYLSGDSVAVNEEEAARWLLSASYRGEPAAEYWLGTLYSRGRGVPADPAQANHWYGASAKQGNAHAMHRLGIANFEGLGTESNPEEAVHWFTEAAERGLVDSQFDLAVLYERGTGVMQSLPDAYKWYAVAAAQGDKEAASRADVLKKSLKPAEVAEATRAAAEFKPESADENAGAVSVAAKSSGD
jgi:TPR repeat protein